MLDFARISIAVPNVTVASVGKNKEEIKTMLEKSAEQGADFVLFPELSLTGATCGDLFFQSSLLNDAVSALNEIADFTEKLKTVAIVGLPLAIAGKLYNCAAVVSCGRVCGIVTKNVGDSAENRWFSSFGSEQVEIMSDEIGIFPSYKITVSELCVFSGRENTRFGVVLGDDFATALPKSSLLASDNAEIIFNMSARYETAGKRKAVKNAITAHSSALKCVYAYASAGIGESTTDYVFPGHGIVCEKGKVISENQKLIDGGYVMNCDVDLGKVRHDRMRNRLAASPVSVARSQIYFGATDKALMSDGSLYPLKKMPFIPDGKDECDERCLEIFEMQVAGLAKRMAVAEKIVIGVSGGLDSTLALLVCVKAMKKLARPVKNVIGVTMPCFGTTSRTFNNSVALMEALGITSMNISIKDACIQHFKDIGHDGAAKDVTFENVQARERTQVLMDVANMNNALVCGTGDLSELTLGWCTYNADHMSMYDVNAGVPKTLIRKMLECLATTEDFSACESILLDVADTPISPELLPPDENGVIAQKTEDSVGPYALHDFYLYHCLRYGFTPEKIKVLAERAFAGEFDGEVIEKWLRVFYRRFATQQFKRSCLADGVKVGTVGISPRGDLAMPSDSAFQR